MKIFKLIILPLIALVLMSASCEKPDPEPVFTQGFSCKINGIEWVAKTPLSIGGPVAFYVDYLENTGELYLTGTKKDLDINIYILNIYEKGMYDIEPLKGNGEESIGFHNLKGSSQCKGFYHDSLNPGTLEICIFDKTKREISGTFNMVLIDHDCFGTSDSTIYITDGKFAFKY